MKIALMPVGNANRAVSRIVVAGVVAAFVAFGSVGASTGAKAVPNISIRLLAPISGTIVPRYGASPYFTWLITAHGQPPPKGSGRLEVSTTPTFSQEAILRFDCGYNPGDCVPHFQWPDSTPHWYDMANSCSDVPPVGNCLGVSKQLYWRVRFQPVGGRSYSSSIGVLQRSLSPDSVAPSVRAEGGSSDYGGPARMLFWAGDNTGLTRYVVQLYDGTKMVFGARTDWRSGVGPYYTYVDLPIPPSVKPGGYRFCVTVIDQADNKKTDCAPYSIE
jgi:hypothetical protein